MANWSALPMLPVLQPGQVDLIQITTPLKEGILERLWLILNEEEQAKANRFKVVDAREQYIIAKAGLRLLLARYLTLAAKELVFDISSHGKPSLQSRQNTLDIAFNLSHTAGMIVYAFTLTIPIGVDVEFPRHHIDYLGIGKRFFSEQEYAVMNSLAKEDIVTGFYNAWTRKEAYIKAIGEGLSHPLDSFDVTLKPGEQAKFLRIANGNNELPEWTLRSFTPKSGYFAAFATRQHVSKVNHFEWFF